MDSPYWNTLSTITTLSSEGTGVASPWSVGKCVSIWCRLCNIPARVLHRLRGVEGSTVNRVTRKTLQGWVCVYRGSGLGSNPIAFTTTILKHIILTDNTVTGKLRLHFSVFQYGHQYYYHIETHYVKRGLDYLKSGLLWKRNRRWKPLQATVVCFNMVVYF